MTQNTVQPLSSQLAPSSNLLLSSSPSPARSRLCFTFPSLTPTIICFAHIQLGPQTVSSSPSTSLSSTNQFSSVRTSPSTTSTCPSNPVKVSRLAPSSLPPQATPSSSCYCLSVFAFIIFDSIDPLTAPVFKMSGRLDQSLQSIIDTSNKAKREARRRKGVKPKTTAAVPVGGVKKTTRPIKSAIKPTPGQGPPSRNSKIVVSGLV